jgi:molybdopterin-guanine dinucleotide biosynthesis protein A
MRASREESRNSLNERVSGVILAGGKSSRMGGRDKAFLTIEGVTFFERALRVLGRCFRRIVVVTNHPERFAAFRVPIVRDELPSLGPLSGLHAGLGRISTPYAFVTACDMPFLRVEPIRFLVSRLKGQQALVPRWDGDVQPLHALYATSLRPEIEAAFGRGDRSLRDLLRSVRAEYVEESVMRQVAGAHECFRNVNTPEEAARFAIELTQSTAVTGG